MQKEGKSEQLGKNEFYSTLNSVLPRKVSSQTNQEDSATGIYFERISMEGLEEMHAYSIDERLYQFLEFDPFVTIDETENYINKLLSRIGDEVQGRTAMYWFVRRVSDNALIGSIGLLNIDYGRLSAEWGFGVDPKHWNGGYIFQMLESLMHYVFDVLKLNRVFSTTASINQPTIAVLKGLGFQFEGELRDYYRFSDGIFHDASIYAMLSRDYTKLKKDSSREIEVVANELLPAVVHIVSELLGSSDISQRTQMHEEPKWDSLKHVSIMLRISEEFNVQLTPDKIAKATSVQSICDMLKSDV